ncbi:hypothetical protein [Methylobacterium nodulans]|uniref:Uncharacterized protein n=1 Tax=Methylobacterium nodulans (strain LMG 21967 / CNCM I-2342 / ORS 2060) TaxID=460265 RepID=B8IHQ0_METNO|nr:hypothetical protein [Methylobacterium nodulans]ACL61713.1 hypothetical protein Mnod_6971 [Methylobacterium nodulans ORS 2060]
MDEPCACPYCRLTRRMMEVIAEEAAASGIAASGLSLRAADVALIALARVAGITLNRIDDIGTDRFANLVVQARDCARAEISAAGGIQ